RTMERAVEALRARGEAFTASLITTQGRQVEAEGRAIGGRAMLRLRLVSGIKRDLVDLGARYERLQAEVEAFRVLIEALPAPVWVRDGGGRLLFANSAYVHAVDAESPDDVVMRGLELLNRTARDDLARSAGPAGTHAARLPAIVAGKRRILDLLQTPTGRGTVGIGLDVTEAESARAEISRISEAHRRTLDQLSTGVAI